jgi:hypothetical protein
MGNRGRKRQDEIRRPHLAASRWLCPVAKQGQHLQRYTGTAPTDQGNITSYTILVSSDNSTFTEATAGTWANNGQYKAATFGPVAARYVRLQVDAASGGSGAQATEVVVGANR